MKKLVDYKKLTKRIWIMLWVILLILVIAKIFFNEWYPIVIESKRLNSLFDIIERTLWLKTIIILLFYLASMLIWYLTATGQKKLTQIKLFISLTILITMYFIKSINNNLGTIIELIYLIIIPIIVNLRKDTFKNKVKNTIIPTIIYIMINCWQFTIYLVRDIPYSTLSSEHFGLSLVLMLDYYIFIIVQWLGVSFMGLWSGGWLFGKSMTELKAIRDEELSKENPNQEMLKEIDKKISEYEKSKEEIVD